MAQTELENRLRVVSINTWKCDGDYIRRMDILETQLKEMQPDIVCCQEVFKSHDGRFDTMGRLLKTLDMSGRFVPLREKTRRFYGNFIRSTSGLGILSRCDIDSHDLLHLPEHPDDKDRSAQMVGITKADRKILLVNTHLTHLKDQAGLRLNQVKHLLDAIALKKEYDLILICGDFNAVPKSPEIKHATAHHQTPFLDLVKTFSKEDHLETCPAFLPGQTPPYPAGRIDYIFTTSPLDRFQNKKIMAGLALNHPSTDGFFASDHFGVFVDIPLTHNS